MCLSIGTEGSLVYKIITNTTEFPQSVNLGHRLNRNRTTAQSRSQGVRLSRENAPSRGLHILESDLFTLKSSKELTAVTCESVKRESLSYRKNNFVSVVLLIRVVQYKK